MNNYMKAAVIMAVGLPFNGMLYASFAVPFVRVYAINNGWTWSQGFLAYCTPLMIYLYFLAFLFFKGVEK